MRILKECAILRSIGNFIIGRSKMKPSRIITNELVSQRRNRFGFWAKVNKKEDDECWTWLGYGTPKGYGLIYVPGLRNVYAHRFSWVLHHGDIPNDLNVLHKCDNPECVNPSHLFLGTAQDNIEDCNRKGRKPKGEDCAWSRVTEEDVLEIRRRYRPSSRATFKNGAVRHPDSADCLAEEFGLSIRHIRRIAYGERWKHI